ncbi:hypothetical protein [Asticcacaulis solisilvae]|uniref:hypothetical protein n=1 Tax=Asticcacaulis solisilvae TaxID=1217274 RepID=UPI003FD78B53
MSKLSANTQYLIGMGGAMTAYAALLVASILILQSHPGLAGPALWAVAVMPALPIGGSIWVFLRYIDQVDEYVRAVTLKRFIVATGLTLFACTAWGFLEENAGAHHFSLYLVYPVFWALYGGASALYRSAA